MPLKKGKICHLLPPTGLKLEDFELRVTGETQTEKISRDSHSHAVRKYVAFQHFNEVPTLYLPPSNHSEELKSPKKNIIHKYSSELWQMTVPEEFECFVKC